LENSSFSKGTAETRVGFLLKTNLQAWSRGKTAEGKAEVNHSIHCCADLGDGFLILVMYLCYPHTCKRQSQFSGFDLQ